MAKANVLTPSGLKVTVEGTWDEVSQIIGSLGHKGGKLRNNRESPTNRHEKEIRKEGRLTSLLLEMRDDGYFDRPKGLMEVKRGLEEKGHIYPVTTLSPVLLGMVQKKMLRRLKQEKRWTYVQA